MNEFNFDKAFRVIRRNYGCPGPDGLSIKHIKSDYQSHKKYLQQQLQNNTFKFGVPRYSLITKNGPKVRTIYIYNLYDKWIQQCINISIEPYYIEPLLAPYVFFSRRGIGDGRKAAAKYILKSKPKYLLRLDILDFFASINRAKLIALLKSTPIPDNLIKLIEDSFIHLPRGIPIGNVLSPKLSNLYLSPLDQLFPKNYARYCDDMFFALSNQAEKSSVIGKVSESLSKLELALNIKKINLVFNPTEESFRNFPALE